MYEHEILTAAALRFDGYGYMRATQFDPPSNYVATFGTATWSFEPLQELALFFLHQRLVLKWAASRPDGSDEWQFMRRLFLRVVDYEIPEQWRVPSYHDDWERRFAPRLEEARALVEATCARYGG